jgi:hypothetical protein
MDKYYDKLLYRPQSDDLDDIELWIYKT